MKAPKLKWLIVSAGSLLVCASFFAAYEIWKRGDETIVTPSPESHSISINGHRLQLEVAATSAEQERGLGGRETLADDAGMIFPISPPSRAGFWMKGMRFPLDFIYLRGAEIVELKENVQPTLVPVPFFPSVSVDGVIEVNAGWVKAHGVKTGEEIGLAI